MDISLLQIIAICATIAVVLGFGIRAARSVHSTKGFSVGGRSAGVPLVAGGDTVVVIEHNLDVIKTADYIIDLGPEGGDKGGTVVATGRPEDIVKVPESYTGKFLRPLLEEKNA